MGTFTSTKSFKANPEFIPFVTRKIKEDFESKGFEFVTTSASMNRTVFKVVKSNLVRNITGLKQGLEVTINRNGENIDIEAKGTVVRDQALASVISLLVTWPVLITQVIGLINQSKLDTRVITVADTAYLEYKASESKEFCPHCGSLVEKGSSFCNHCGNVIK